jgi:type II secretory pathway component PulF
VGEIKDELDRTQREVARGRSDQTPVLISNILFLGIGAFVGLIVMMILLIYYFA